MKKFGIFMLISMLFIACSDDKELSPPAIKDSVAKDLNNTVWTPTQGSNFFKSLKFIDGVIEGEFENGGTMRYGYHISNVNAVTELPEVLEINVKSSYKYFYILMKKDYSSFDLTMQPGDNVEEKVDANFKK